MTIPVRLKTHLDQAHVSFGELYGLPVYLDEALAEDPEIVFSAGTLCNAIRMGNLDFVRLAKPRICSFAKKP